MAVSNSSLRLLLVALVLATFCIITAYAAEIRVDPSRRAALGVVLEGRIEPGDFDKLRTIIFNGEGALEIYLASPGGDLAEAMKIGRLVRELKLRTVAPDNLGGELREKLAARHALKDSKANYMCASACFFVFVAGIHRQSDFVHEAILGIHKPYLSKDALRALSSDKAIAVADQTRAIVDSYLREMSVPAKYADQMFSVPKDEIRWIGHGEFETDFAGFVPELRDWVDARCDSRSGAEKRNWEVLKNKTRAEQSADERATSDALMKKYEEQTNCEIELQPELALRAYRDGSGRR
jgi:hypothetical protein